MYLLGQPLKHPLRLNPMELRWKYCHELLDIGACEVQSETQEGGKVHL